MPMPAWTNAPGSKGQEAAPARRPSSTALICEYNSQWTTKTLPQSPAMTPGFCIGTREESFGSAKPMTVKAMPWIPTGPCSRPSKAHPASMPSRAPRRGGFHGGVRSATASKGRLTAGSGERSGPWIDWSTKHAAVRPTAARGRTALGRLGASPSSARPAPVTPRSRMRRARCPPIRTPRPARRQCPAECRQSRQPPAAGWQTPCGETP